MVRCASGTLWYDGWCLDSRGATLVVEFQDQQTQLSARDLDARLAEEGGKHACVRTNLAIYIYIDMQALRCGAG